MISEKNDDFDWGFMDDTPNDDFDWGFVDDTTNDERDPTASSRKRKRAGFLDGDVDPELVLKKNKKRKVQTESETVGE